MRHPVFARLYAALSPLAERRGMARERGIAVEGLRGRVLEVGAGGGLMFRHYPPAVTQVVATEPEPYLRARAMRAARDAPVAVTVSDAMGEHLPFADDAFDAVVCVLVLCSVADPPAVLDEMGRVLAPGGELRFLEHVAPARGPGRRVAQVLDRSGIWPRVAGGCHLCRDTGAAIRDSGFVIERMEQGRPRGEPLPVPFIRGVARHA